MIVDNHLYSQTIETLYRQALDAAIAAKILKDDADALSKDLDRRIVMGDLDPDAVEDWCKTMQSSCKIAREALATLEDKIVAMRGARAKLDRDESAL